MASRPPDENFRPPPPTGQETARFVTINAVRITGVALAILGILLTQDAIDLAGDQNRLIGIVFIVTGLADLFVLPLVLARKWRTPKP